MNGEKVVMTCVFGSKLYGTDTPTSDNDYKSIIIPSVKDIILQRVKPSKNTHREKAEGEKNYAGELDMETFSYGKYLQLILEGQTVAMDMLFVPDKYLLESSREWRLIQLNRHLLISRKAEAFVGYCMQQAKKYGIKGSRVDAVRKTLNFLRDLVDDYEWTGDKLGSWEQYIRKFVENENNEFIKIEVQDHPSGVSITFLEVCGRKMSFTASIKNVIEMMQRLLEEYGKRALMAEKNEGVDWKALSHAVRIAEQAIELFNTGHIEFPRPNAEYLRDIKLGKYDYKEIAEKIEDNFIKVKEASEKSTLPETVDKNLVDKMIFEAYMNQCLKYPQEI